MSQPFYWLTLTTLLTALMWLPYILNAIMVRGLLPTLANPTPDAKPLAPWAERAKKAHYNAVENLVVFATLVIVAKLSNVPEATAALAATVYFFARLIHYVVYTLGIPVLRTLAFFTGVGVQVALGIQILQNLSS